MKKNYSLILRKIIFAFNSISVIGIAIFILYTTRKKYVMHMLQVIS